MPPRYPLFAFATLALASLNPAFGEAVKVDTGKPRQWMEGFGACTIQWNDTVQDLYETQAFRDILTENLRPSICRFEISPLMQAEVSESSAIQSANWSDTQDPANVRPSYRLAAYLHKEEPARNKVVGSVWSPPGWMKVSGQTRGGDPETNRLKPGYEPYLAAYLVAFIQWYERVYGVPMYAISPQNELGFDEPYNSCIYTHEGFATLIAELGQQMEAAGLWPRVKIFGPEHMTFLDKDTADYIAKVMIHPVASKYLDRFAAHGYTDGVESDSAPQTVTRLWDRIKRYNRPFWMSETSGEDNTWANGSARLGALDGLAAKIHNSLAYGQASAFIHWQFTDMSSAQEYALMELSEQGPKFNVMRHYAYHIRPGAVRVDVASADPLLKPINLDTETTAFVHEADRTMTLVLLNRQTSARTLDLEFVQGNGLSTFAMRRSVDGQFWSEGSRVSVNAGKASLSLPARSITTLHATDFNPVYSGWLEEPTFLGKAYAYSENPGWFWHASLGYFYRALRDQNWIYLQDTGDWAYLSQADRTRSAWWVFDRDGGYRWSSTAYGRWWWNPESGWRAL